MITLEKINKSQEKIYQLIYEQCLYGAQTTSSNNGYIACGQFLGHQAKNLMQRGMYGTSSALCVLARTENKNAKELIPKLIDYLELRLDPKLRDKEHSDIPQISHRDNKDSINVIKISEILYSLSFVKTGICKTEEFSKSLAEHLLCGIIDNKGWGHFIDPSIKDIELLPTAYAIQALSANGYLRAIEKPIEYLKCKLEEIYLKNSSNDSTDISIHILCLYVLIFLTDDLSKTEKETFKNILYPIWRSLEPLLNVDLEQNIEYWHGNENHYVRIPWQLYLIAITSRLSPFRMFGSFTVQKRMGAILNDVLNKGFRYPHSGKMVSTRTNTILFNILNDIKINLRQPQVYLVFYLWDRTRSFLSKPYIMYIAYLFSLTLIAFSIYKWLDKSANFGDLAPDFLAVLIITLLTLRKRR